MVSKEQKIKEIKEFIKDNPSLNSNDTLKEIRLKGLGIRKTDYLKIFRESRKLPEPTPEKREKSIPKKFKTKEAKEKAIKVKKEIEVKEKIKEQKIARETAREIKAKVKKERIPFEKTKFGKMTKTVQTTFNISEKNAIRRVRKLLKIPKDDFPKLNQKDFNILTQFGY